MTLEESLIKFGLDPKEAKIYLAALELGPATVLQISKKSEVKRPTTYVLLDKLAGQGYISKTYQANRLLYAAEAPEILLRTLRNKEETLRESLPLLQAIMASAKARPKISIYEGREGVWKVYEEIFSSPEITFFGCIKDINRYFADAPKKVLALSRNKQSKVRDLLTLHPDDLAYAKEAVQDNPNYEIHFLPQGMYFSIDCAIFGNKIAILSVQKDLFATLIESKEVADSFRALHTLAWSAATPIEKLTTLEHE